MSGRLLVGWNYGALMYVVCRALRNDYEGRNKRKCADTKGAEGCRLGRGISGLLHECE